MMKRPEKGERGATLIEAALVYPLLFLTLFGVLEFGLAFKDWLSVSHAAREGARAGATYGSDLYADMEILRDVERTLAPAGIGSGTEVFIHDATTAPGFSPYVYSPGTGCTDIPGCCDWTPCPDPDRPSSYVLPPWPPSDRDDSAPCTDRIAVEVRFTHNWLTGFFVPSSDFTTSTDFQIEPQIFDEDEPC